MKIVNLKSIEENDAAGPLFVGGKVYTQLLLQEAFGGDKIQVVNVKFTPGSRNKFHTHTTEQILFVIEGQGIVATRDEEHTVTPRYAYLFRSRRRTLAWGNRRLIFRPFINN